MKKKEREREKGSVQNLKIKMKLIWQGGVQWYLIQEEKMDYGKSWLGMGQCARVSETCKRGEWGKGKGCEDVL